MEGGVRCAREERQRPYWPCYQRQLLSHLYAPLTTQVLQLLLVNAALILWPASLAPGGLLLARVWLLYGESVSLLVGWH